jgi:homoserine/homoserine lactone efflux protein
VADFHLLYLYALMDLLACLTPGPAVMAVVGHALGGSLRGAAGAITGINLGNLVWFTLVALGLVALVHSAPLLFVLLRWVGIAYLVYVGISLWRGSHAVVFRRNPGNVDFARGMASAIAVQLSNPKALIFFTVLLPPFINASRPVVPQLATLAIIGCVIEASVLAGYAILAYRMGQLALRKGAAHWIGRVSGAALIGAAGTLAWTGTR